MVEIPERERFHSDRIAIDMGKLTSFVLILHEFCDVNATYRKVYDDIYGVHRLVSINN